MPQWDKLTAISIEIEAAMAFNPDNLDFFGSEVEEGQVNQLLKYLQHQSPEILATVAKSVSPEIRQIISQNVQGLVGFLPSESFNVQVTTDRENLASLLASAMMTGYFLRRMEQRMELEASVRGSFSWGQDEDENSSSSTED
jgi:hypothetical protein